jgi:pSer/pThr/pTyr-binding forkhead associated (FHA) protein
VWVRDFDSTNGTYVNDEQVRTERELRDGDHLKVDPLAFRISIERTPEDDLGLTARKPAKSKRPDESAIGAMLLDEERDEDAVDLLDMDDEGEYGSTIIDNPLMPASGQKGAGKRNS